MAERVVLPAEHPLVGAPPFSFPPLSLMWWWVVTEWSVDGPCGRLHLVSGLSCQGAARVETVNLGKRHGWPEIALHTDAEALDDPQWLRCSITMVASVVMELVMMDRFPESGEQFDVAATSHDGRYPMSLERLEWGGAYCRSRPGPLFQVVPCYDEM